MAEGVRLYAQDTWTRVMGTSGRQMVADHAGQVVAYYIAQSKAGNHAVREAACACIAELMEKVRGQVCACVRAGLQRQLRAAAVQRFTMHAPLQRHSHTHSAAQSAPKKASTVLLCGNTNPASEPCCCVLVAAAGGPCERRAARALPATCTHLLFQRHELAGAGCRLRGLWQVCGRQEGQGEHWDQEGGLLVGHGVLMARGACAASLRKASHWMPCGWLKG